MLPKLAWTRERQACLCVGADGLQPAASSNNATEALKQGWRVLLSNIDCDTLLGIRHVPLTKFAMTFDHTGLLSMSF